METRLIHAGILAQAHIAFGRQYRCALDTWHDRRRLQSLIASLTAGYLIRWIHWTFA